MKPNVHIRPALLLMIVFLVISATLSFSQEAKKKLKPVKNTFESVWIGDNQTVMVPIKKTLELDIMHRFGTWEKGYEDFFGLFAPSNIRLGASYSIIKNLNVGVGITKANMLWDASAKYAIIRQTKELYPVSVTYYTNVSLDTRKEENFYYRSDRLSFFHQLLIARKVTDKISVQVAPSLSHINSVNGYYSEPGKVSPSMKHDHIAIAVSGRYKLTETSALFFNYDQPITKHPANNPNPNISAGIEKTTSAHAFQFFAGNYFYMSPQRNNYFNHNDFQKGQYLIGFNITRLWNY
jgi:hypothetical protein